MDRACIELGEKLVIQRLGEEILVWAQGLKVLEFTQCPLVKEFAGTFPEKLPSLQLAANRLPLRQRSICGGKVPNMHLGERRLPLAHGHLLPLLAKSAINDHVVTIIVGDLTQRQWWDLQFKGPRCRSLVQDGEG